MKVFVTGLTGFVGAAFLKAAAGKNISITGLVRRDSKAVLPRYDHVEWLQKNLDEVQSEDVAGHDLILHMAAHTANPPYADHATSIYWNVYAPLKLFELAEGVGVRRYVNIGSCFEYADGFCDEDRGLKTDAPLGAVASYPSSKAAATIAMEGFARDKKIELTTLRLFQVYGEGELSSRLYPGLVAAAREGRDFPMTSGIQVRDFVCVDSVAEKICSALGETFRPDAGYPVVRHVASGIPKTVLAFSQEVWRDEGASGRLLPGTYPDRSEQFKYVYSDPSCII